MHIFFFRLFTAIFLLFGVSASAQTPFWKQTNGPSGGSNSKFMFNSNGDIFNIYYTYSYSHELLRSTNDGASWKNITPDFLTTYVEESVISANDNIYIVANNLIYRSQDNGETWKLILQNKYGGG